MNGISPKILSRECPSPHKYRMQEWAEQEVRKTIGASPFAVHDEAYEPQGQHR